MTQTNFAFGFLQPFLDTMPFCMGTHDFWQRHFRSQQVHRHCCAIGFGILRINDLPEQVADVMFIAVLLPAVVICEKLGFGHFNIFSGSTIPDWLLFSVMIAFVYLYSLILVVIGRLVVRLLAGWVRGGRGER